MAIVLLRSCPKDSAPLRLMLDKVDQLGDQRISGLLGHQLQESLKRQAASKILLGPLRDLVSVVCHGYRIALSG